jgi:hypothetical protein
MKSTFLMMKTNEKRSLHSAYLWYKDQTREQLQLPKITSDVSLLVDF